MKHGPIALIDDLMPVVFIAPKDGVHQKVVSNIEEVKARGGRVIAIVTRVTRRSTSWPITGSRFPRLSIC